MAEALEMREAMRRNFTRVLFFAIAFGLRSLPCAAQANPAPPDFPAIVHAIEAARIERTITTLVSFGTRNTLSAQDDPKRGIGAARNWIEAEFQKIARNSGGRLTVSRQTFIQPIAPRVPAPTPLTNIVAILGADLPNPDKRYILVSGHYDSICSDPIDAVHDAPGANDDASGVAAVLECARVLSRYRFRTPIVFLAVAGEEQGLLGSGYCAEQAKLNGWQVAAMFTNDIIGSSHSDTGRRDNRAVRVFSEGVPTDETPAQATVRKSVGGENDSTSRQLARYIQETGAKFLPQLRVNLIYRRDRYLRGGDHIPFNERGFPAVRFTEPNEDYRHQHQNVRTENGVQYGDLPQFVDFDYVAQVARLNAVTLASLAAAPAAPTDAVIVTIRLTNDTELRWQANHEPDLAGYEIVWRETTAANWTHRRLVGNVTDYIVKGRSKDNFIFGIRAIDKAGNRSTVAYPRPVK